MRSSSRLGNADALAGAIERLLADADLAAMLARTALAEAPAYSWERRAERLEALFGEVIAAG